MALNERIGHLAGIFVTASRRLVCHITSHRLFPSGGAPQTRVLPYAAKLCSPMHNSDDAFATVALLLIRSSGSTVPAIALDVHADHRVACVLVIVTRQIRILLFISFVYTLRERFQLVETCDFLRLSGVNDRRNRKRYHAYVPFTLYVIFTAIHPISTRHRCLLLLRDILGNTGYDCAYS